MSAKNTQRQAKSAERPLRGRADLQRLRAMTEEEIERLVPPELASLPDDFWADATMVEPVIKLPISIRVDEDVLGWFRASGPGYQTRMNAVLRAYMKGKQRVAKPSASRRRKAPTPKRS